MKDTEQLQELTIDFFTYQPLAMRTLNRALSQEQRLCSGALGLCGELAELTPWHPEPAELGDITWYIALLCEATQHALPAIYLGATKLRVTPALTSVEQVYTMMCFAGAIADRIKKVCMQGHPLEAEDFRKPLEYLLAHFLLFCASHNLSMKSILEGNISKLRSRYPEGFSEQNSVNRTM